MRNLMLAGLLGLVVAGSASADVAPPTPRPVVEAERAFAADGAALGIKKSFLAHMADDAITFAPGPVGAKALYGGRPDPKPDAPRTLLEWWPMWAGISRSGDLGFTTGPVAINGKPPGFFYFTVWQKQPDGQWKWIFDGGAGADAAGAPARDAEPGYLPVSSQPGQYPESARADVDRAEGALKALAASDLVGAYRYALACDALVYTEGLVPARGCATHEAALKGRPARIQFTQQGGTVSAAGDLAFTYGEAGWLDAEGKPGHGQYARIWQRRDGAWKLVFDELVNDPPTPPPPKAS